MKDLTQSAIDRQNILNNEQAMLLIQSKIGLTGLLFNNEYIFTTKMVAEFYGVTTRTVTNILNNYEEEVKHNGYTLLTGEKLKNIKDQFGYLLSESDDISQRDIDVPLSNQNPNDVSQTETDFPLSHQNPDNQSYKRIKALAVFNFRAVLNLGMLLTESEKAKQVRSLLLDVVIDTINKRMGGSTKYINQRDEEFLVAITREPAYRKEFTNALNLYLEMGPMKYSIYTDAIYNAIFNENAREYKAILKLEEKDNARVTMYAEVLKLIASFEIGIADEMHEHSEKLGRKLKPSELNLLIDSFAKKRLWIPQIEDARAKMASRDYGLRNIIHQRLQNYIGALSTEDYKRFLGDKSQNLIDRVLDNPELIEVFKRLKDR
jgi:hypothetical protein